MTRTIFFKLSYFLLGNGHKNFLRLEWMKNKILAIKIIPPDNVNSGTCGE